MEEELQTIQPEPDMQQQQADLEVMEQTPNVADEVPQSEPVAGMGSTVSKTLFKEVKKRIADNVKLDNKKQSMVDALRKSHGVDMDKSARIHKERMENGEFELTPPEQAPVSIPENKEIVSKRFYELSEKPNKTFDEEREFLKVSEEKKDFDLEEKFHGNYELISGNDDITDLMQHFAEQNQDLIMDAKQGVVTFEDTRELADALGESPEAIKKILTRKKGETMNHAYVALTTKLVTEGADYMQRLARKIKEGDNQTKTLHMFSQQYHYMKLLYSQFTGMKAENARALNASKIQSGSPDFEKMQMMESMENLGHNISIEQLAKDIANVGTGDYRTLSEMAKPQSKIINGVLRAEEVVFNSFVNSILSGAKTHVINTIGSQLRLGVDQFDRFIGAFMPSSGSYETDKIDLSEVGDLFTAKVLSFKTAMREVGHSMRTGEVYGNRATIESHEVEDVLTPRISKIKQPIAYKTLNTLASPLKIQQAYVKNTMSASDALTKSLAYESQLMVLAKREAKMIANKENLTEEETADLFQDLVTNPSEEMSLKLEQRMKDVSFQNNVNKHLQWLQTGSRTPFVRFTIPFIRTPLDVLSQGFMERTPLAVVAPRFHRDFQAGGESKQLALSKLATGSSASLMLWELIDNGTIEITGSRASGKGQGKINELTDKQDRSLVFSVGDEKWRFQYDRLEPFSYILGAIADIHGAVNKQGVEALSDEDASKFENAGYAVLTAIAENSYQKSFMTGLQNITNMIDDPKRYMKSYMHNMANSIVPLSGARRDFVRTFTDNEKRTSDTALEFLQTNMPFLSNYRPHKLDLFGNKTTTKQQMNPFKLTQEDALKATPLNKELDRLMKATDLAPFYDISRTVGGIELTDEEFHDVKILSRKTLKLGGKTLKEKLTQLITRDSFKKAIDEDKIDKIRDVVKKYDQMAKKKYQKMNKSLREKIYRKDKANKAKRSMRDNNATLIQTLDKMVDEKRSKWQNDNEMMMDKMEYQYPELDFYEDYKK